MSHSSSRAARSVKESKRRSIDRKMAVIKKYWRVGISGQEQKKPIETLEKVLFLLSIFSAGIFQIFYYFRPQITIFENPHVSQICKVKISSWSQNYSVIVTFNVIVTSSIIKNDRKIPLYIMIACYTFKNDQLIFLFQVRIIFNIYWLTKNVKYSTYYSILFLTRL